MESRLTLRARERASMSPNRWYSKAFLASCGVVCRVVWWVKCLAEARGEGMRTHPYDMVVDRKEAEETGTRTLQTHTYNHVNTSNHPKSQPCTHPEDANGADGPERRPPHDEDGPVPPHLVGERRLGLAICALWYVWVRMVGIGDKACHEPRYYPATQTFQSTQRGKRTRPELRLEPLGAHPCPPPGHARDRGDD